MAVWLDSRAFHKKEPLRQACGFVIVNSQVHDEFDQFKKSHSQYDYSLLESIELLQLWLSRRGLTKESVEQYNKKYVKLHNTEIDSLCTWVGELREKYYTVGESVFQIDSPAELPLLTGRHNQDTCEITSRNTLKAKLSKKGTTSTQKAGK